MGKGLLPSGWVFLALGWGTILFFTIFSFAKVLFAKKKKQKEFVSVKPTRERWATRIGLILAMAGNAIGLGNFLRFPSKAAANGGGAFLIPYFIALLFLGVPLMWTEWTIGRFGGTQGHGTTPGMFSMMWKNPMAKYLGALGISIPFAVIIYYQVIESWCLGFAWFSGTSKYWGAKTYDSMGRFLHGFQGMEKNEFFVSYVPLLLFVALNLFLIWYFLYRGIAKGIELLAKIGMPVLFVFGIALAIRVLTLGTPDPSHPEMSVAAGMGFMWNPDFSRLGSSTVWLAAAGQIFFTLSLGQGVIATYASYLGKNDDVTLNGLTTSATNEFAEVILGGTIAIPVAVAFFGVQMTRQIATSPTGTFDLGFQSLPVIFQKLPLGQLFGAMWFLLLFIAGITSAVAMTQPAIAFLEDELKWSRKKAVNLVILVLAITALLVVFFFRFGFLDELDFWAGTLGLVVFALLEVVIFSWVFGIKKGWEEMHRGADIRVPRIFKFFLKYVTPVYLLALVIAWTLQDAIGKFLMKTKPGETPIDPASYPYRWGARALFALLIVATILLVRIAWQKRKREARAAAKA
jgi:NSS family neurotransmitter:Na+ symporter